MVKLNADLPDSEEYMVHVLKKTKDTLRRVPDKGFGYGVIKYLTPPGKKDINFTGAPEISFNYLGQFESGTAQLKYLRRTPSHSLRLVPEVISAQHGPVNSRWISAQSLQKEN
nr:hypothetical protein P5640_06595 [Bacillus subtilis]